MKSSLLLFYDERTPNDVSNSLGNILASFGRSVPTVSLALLTSTGICYCGPKEHYEMLADQLLAFINVKSAAMQSQRALYRLMSPTNRTMISVMVQRLDSGLVIAGSYRDRDPVSKSLRRGFARLSKNLVRAMGGYSAEIALNDGAAIADYAESPPTPKSF